MGVFTNMRAKLVSAIQTASTKVASAQVYDSEASKFGGFPAITVAPVNNEADFNDTSNRRYELIYNVTIYEEITQTGQASADSILDDVMDELLVILNDKDTDWSPAEWIVPTPANWGYQDRPEGMVRTATLQVRCVIFINN